MPAYVDIAYVKSLAPTATADTSRDTLYPDVIGSVLRRIDKRTGQYFASGYDGYLELMWADISFDHRRLFLPRMFEIESLECRNFYGDDDWSEFDGTWRKTLVYPQQWTGYDTIEIPNSAPSMHSWRVKGKVGWGHGTADENDPFNGDPVPPEIKIEVAKQCRSDIARLPLGGSGGGNIYSGDLATDMDGWDLLRSVKMTCKDFFDGRRLIFS